MLLADDVEFFLSPGYEKYIHAMSNVRYTDRIQAIINSKPDIIFVYNISIGNLRLFTLCKKNTIKIVYMLHEPLVGINELIAEGRDIIKTIGANIINTILCAKADKVLLASEKGKIDYEKYMRKWNNHYDIFPLIFLDEYDSTKEIKRKYFSFIGGFTDAHACKDFLKFVDYCLSEDIDMIFLIATKTDLSELQKRVEYQKAINSGRLIICSGRPMTVNEINDLYRQSICVWNAYNRSTQSGVLANAMMQGTPAIVNECGSANEIVKDRIAGCYIQMPPDNEQVLECYRYIEAHLNEMESAARRVFMTHYYYKNHIELARKVILEL